ncbi:hypothetical protein ABZ260_44570 [Streptosporangium sp. NPDC006013]
MNRLIDLFGDPAGVVPRISGRRLAGVATGSRTSGQRFTLWSWARGAV